MSIKYAREENCNMEKADVELELIRDEAGLITQMSYKVTNPGDEGKRAIEFVLRMTQKQLKEYEKGMKDYE